MEITSPAFIILCVVSVFVFYLVDPKYRILLLTILSAGFIGSLNVFLLAYIIAYALINYYIAFKIKDSHQKVNFFKLGIFINLIQLILLKYSTFAIDPIFNLIGIRIELSKLSEIILPIGISYFTLQGIGYLINIKMGWEKPESNFLHFFLYIVFGGKFLSGPIERSNHFLPQLRSLLIFDRQNIVVGFRMMLSGLVQKVVVANQLSLIVTPVYDKLNSSEGWMLILVIIANPLYLYFDFSGYTNIALGLARIFGVELLPNFNKPFLSENVTGFWKRFHMSLSLWFNDYVFKQASFRLRGYKSFASVIAVFITWFLFGIWHGAGWNFMVLGVIQAIAIIYEFYTKKQRYKVFSRLSPFLKKWIGRIITYLFFGVSLVFFFSTDLKSSVKFFSGLKSLALEIPSTTAPIIISDKISFFIALIIMIGFLFMELLSVDHDRIYQRIDNLWKSNKTRVMLLRYSIYYFAIALVFYFGGMQSEFVYFQF